MKAKRGYFHPGRMAYLVKWVGYSEEHNSWVDEPDAGNAEDLIQQFWRESKSQKAAAPAGRKSVGDKPAPKKNGRVSSLAREESSDNDSAAPAKKRGRPSKGGAVAAATKTKARDEDEDERAVKKARKSTTTSVATKRDKLSKKADAMDVDGDDDEDDGEPDKPIGSMKEHMSTQSWESLVKVVDTVERDDDGTIYVYFTVYVPFHSTSRLLLSSALSQLQASTCSARSSPRSPSAWTRARCRMRMHEPSYREAVEIEAV
ncbi:hypothetical protein CONPUDRAFT_126722 [Coniophora puteana RWD-64-598 SS2]|uniref:Chromo domain-containing protein n=1 Tax=Coniophora puteana (strain RWD-64-598) TaxID=741705 RepID=A0A5M3MJ17_CONPW|nr:uncharacterized protein CONPUDRAFT_126722 [Coniophora puteana RWD-64-598 SS2]EIW78977.1 hypothetical protein CONPUDRAFT_126722 [Coniophora puteana RWD-64-598 SS2]